MAESRDLVELVDRPVSGRAFVGNRTVSLADVTPTGRMRFDSMARFLGDIGNDDTDDAGFAELGVAWLARRSTMVVHSFPASREKLTMSTWCAGTGRRWAERRTSITGDQGGHVEAAALWVHIDIETGRPTAWGDEFAACYLEAAGGRKVGSKLLLPKTPPQNGAPVNEMAWQFRRTDLDVFDHVNNAAYLAVVEEIFGGAALGGPLRLDIEWHRPTVAGVPIRVVEQVDEASMTIWLCDESGTCAVIAGGPC